MDVTRRNLARAISALALALVLAACAAPSWMPLVGKSGKDVGAAAAPAPEPAKPAAIADVRGKLLDADDAVVDRIVAVVNNDAITLVELQEALVATRQERRVAGQPSEEELTRLFLSRLIDSRLQLQEADREKIVVEDSEIEEELADRMKKLPGNATRADFEADLKAQGITMDAIKRRLRDSLRLSKIVRRKVALRVSVTDAEVERYLDQNRAKLETGLAYHARHILLTPDATGASDAAWEAARIRAELLRSQLLAGADFAEVARQHSRDATARDGGDLGTLKRGELAAEIEAEILMLELGDVSLPYRSPLGFHLFRLDSKEKLEGEGLARARQQIRDILFREKYDARLEAWLKEIKQRALIEVRI